MDNGYKSNDMKKKEKISIKDWMIIFLISAIPFATIIAAGYTSYNLSEIKAEREKIEEINNDFYVSRDKTIIKFNDKIYISGGEKESNYSTTTDKKENYNESSVVEEVYKILLEDVDTNHNGKITIAEAKAAGYSMPIYSDQWLYQYMTDRDSDGMVGE